MNYTIQNLFLEAFGLKISKYYNIESNNGNPKEPSFLFNDMIFVEDKKEIIEISGLGTPIVAPIRFLEGTYKRYNSYSEIINIKKHEFRLPISSIVKFTREKEFEFTKSNGSMSSTKERFIFDDWKINIMGFFIEDKSQPQGFYNVLLQEKELISWEELVCSIPVLSSVFELKGIKFITIKSILVEPMRGRPNIRSFNIEALSDDPFDLVIKDDPFENINNKN
jgi:Domain of unknown function (DUF6046)